MNVKNLCETCALRKHFRLNLLKTDKVHPRIYHIECSMSSQFTAVEKCDYYRKKRLKHRLGMGL